MPRASLIIIGLLIAFAIIIGTYEIAASVSSGFNLTGNITNNYTVIGGNITNNFVTNNYTLNVTNITLMGVNGTGPANYIAKWYNTTDINQSWIFENGSVINLGNWTSRLAVGIFGNIDMNSFNITNTSSVATVNASRMINNSNISCANISGTTSNLCTILAPSGAAGNVTGSGIAGDLALWSNTTQLTNYSMKNIVNFTTLANYVNVTNLYGNLSLYINATLLYANITNWTATYNSSYLINNTNISYVNVSGLRAYILTFIKPAGNVSGSGVEGYLARWLNTTDINDSSIWENGSQINFTKNVISATNWTFGAGNFSGSSGTSGDSMNWSATGEEGVRVGVSQPFGGGSPRIIFEKDGNVWTIDNAGDNLRFYEQASTSGGTTVSMRINNTEISIGDWSAGNYRNLTVYGNITANNSWGNSTYYFGNGSMLLGVAIVNGSNIINNSNISCSNISGTTSNLCTIVGVSYPGNVTGSGVAGDLALWSNVTQLTNYSMSNIVNFTILANYVNFTVLANYVNYTQLANYVNFTQLANYVNFSEAKNYLNISNLSAYVNMTTLYANITNWTATYNSSYLINNTNISCANISGAVSNLCTIVGTSYPGNVTGTGIAGDLALWLNASHLTNYSMQNIVNFTTLANYVNFTNLANYVNGTILYGNLSDYVNKTILYGNLSYYVNYTNLANYVNFTNLANYANFTTLGDYVNKTILYGNLSDYVNKTILYGNLSYYVNYTNLANYVNFTHLANYINATQFYGNLTSYINATILYGNLSYYVNFTNLANYVNFTQLANYVNFTEAKNYLNSTNLTSIYSALSTNLSYYGNFTHLSTYANKTYAAMVTHNSALINNSNISANNVTTGTFYGGFNFTPNTGGNVSFQNGTNITIKNPATTNSSGLSIYDSAGDCVTKIAWNGTHTTIGSC